MDAEQIRRIVDVVRNKPGISFFDLDEIFNGMIIGVGNVSGITEDKFDASMIGTEKPLRKEKGGYFVNA